MSSQRKRLRERVCECMQAAYSKVLHYAYMQSKAMQMHDCSRLSLSAGTKKKKKPVPPEPPFPPCVAPAALPTVPACPTSPVRPTGDDRNNGIALEFAIANAGGDCVLMVEAGTYALFDTPVAFPRGVQLRGAQAGVPAVRARPAESTILIPRPLDCADGCFFLTGPNSSIDGFSFVVEHDRGADDYVRIQDGADNSQVVNNFFSTRWFAGAGGATSVSADTGAENPFIASNFFQFDEAQRGDNFGVAIFGMSGSTGLICKNIVFGGRMLMNAFEGDFITFSENQLSDTFGGPDHFFSVGQPAGDPAVDYTIEFVGNTYRGLLIDFVGQQEGAEQIRGYYSDPSGAFGQDREVNLQEISEDEGIFQIGNPICDDDTTTIRSLVVDPPTGTNRVVEVFCADFT
mmetsp:Transcript_47241/g.93200  ORF Transcript_47241/g.93200 Transcript_47241/m.93200 type:complete len:402 (-) Transcript_47241:729-1934(-)